MSPARIKGRRQQPLPPERRYFEKLRKQLANSLRAELNKVDIPEPPMNDSKKGYLLEAGEKALKQAVKNSGLSKEDFLKLKTDRLKVEFAQIITEQMQLAGLRDFSVFVTAEILYTGEKSFINFEQTCKLFLSKQGYELLRRATNEQMVNDRTDIVDQISRAVKTAQVKARRSRNIATRDEARKLAKAATDVKPKPKPQSKPEQEKPMATSSDATKEKPRFLSFTVERKDESGGKVLNTFDTFNPKAEYAWHELGTWNQDHMPEYHDFKSDGLLLVNDVSERFTFNSIEPNISPLYQGFIASKQCIDLPDDKTAPEVYKAVRAKAEDLRDVEKELLVQRARVIVDHIEDNITHRESLAYVRNLAERVKEEKPNERNLSRFIPTIKCNGENEDGSRMALYDHGLYRTYAYEDAKHNHTDVSVDMDGKIKAVTSYRDVPSKGALEREQDKVHYYVGRDNRQPCLNAFVYDRTCNRYV